MLNLVPENSACRLTVVLCFILATNQNTCWSQSISSKYGVSDQEAPNAKLFSWSGKSYKEELNNAKQSDLLMMRTKSVVDCQHYKLDNDVISALTEGNSKNLRWLKINGLHITQQDLKWIGKLNRLRGLALVSIDLRNKDLSDLDGLKSLEWLSVSYCHFGKQREWLPSFPKLEVLHINSSRFGDSHLAIITKERYPHLKVISMIGAKVKDVGLITFFDDHPELRAIDMMHCNYVSRKIIPSLKNLTKLQLIHVGRTAMERNLFDRGTQSIPELKEALPKNCDIWYGD